MPIRTWVDHDLRLIRAEVWGEYTAEDILRATDEVLAYPKYSSRYAILSDHRRVAKVATPAQLDRLMVHLSANKGEFAGRRWAIVTGSHAAYGMARMMAGRAERIDFHVGAFADLDAALRWAATDEATYPIEVLVSGEDRATEVGPSGEVGTPVTGPAGSLAAAPVMEERPRAGGT